MTKLDGNIGQSTKAHFLTQVKSEPLEDEMQGSKFPVDTKSGTKNYQFGPFAPVSAPPVPGSEDNKAKSIHDLGSLATTYRPQYHNQGIYSASHEAHTNSTMIDATFGTLPLH